LTRSGHSLCIADGLGGLEIEDQLDFRDLLHWQVGRLLALENPPGVDAGYAVHFRIAAAVARQAAGRDEGRYENPEHSQRPS